MIEGIRSNKWFQQDRIQAWSYLPYKREDDTLPATAYKLFLQLILFQSAVAELRFKPTITTFLNYYDNLSTTELWTPAILSFFGITVLWVGLNSNDSF